jgi:ribosomal protein S13
MKFKNLNNSRSLYKKKYNFRLDFGIGLNRFYLILIKLGLNFNFKLKRFLYHNINIIKRYKLIIFYKKWFVVNKLKYRIKQYFKFFTAIKNYKYLRFKYGLPVNGQRTHTNKKNSFKGLVRVSALINRKNSKNKKFKRFGFNINYKLKRYKK